MQARKRVSKVDNAKTGTLIRQLRKEKGMTQKELARLLHVTDRAVSKWECGLSAPDVALLELLAQTLGVTVLELIQGERTQETQQNREMKESIEHLLNYSKQEIAYKMKRLRKWLWSGGIAAIVLIASVVLFFVWNSGALFVIERLASPDGDKQITVYSKALDINFGFSAQKAVSLIVDKGKDDGEWRVTYGDCEYQGVYWAPDSKKYVLSMKDKTGNRLTLAWLDRNSESNLNAYLSMGVWETELAKGNPTDQGEWPDIEYQFLQWSKDSAAMLIYYSFADDTGEQHEGYFWYNCENGKLSAVLEVNPL